MRSHEIFEDLEPLVLDEDVIDEDLKSLGRKAATAGIAAAMAAAGANIAKQSSASAAPAASTQSSFTPFSPELRGVPDGVDMNIDKVNPPDYDKAEQDAADAAKKEKAEQDAAFEHDVKMMALTMWGEARGHGPKGMRAVGHVILNRLNSKRNFGDTIEGVVKKRKHFSCWNKGDPNRERMLQIDKLKDGSAGKKRWIEAQQIAREILSGQSKDATKGAIFYHTTGVAPAWSKGVDPIAKVENHLFYRTDAKA